MSFIPRLRRSHSAARDSYTLFLMATCAVTSINMFATGTAPSNLERLLDDRFEWGWAALLLISSTLVIAGIFWPKVDISRIFEMTGCVGMFFASMAYGIAVYAVSAAPSVSLAGPFFIGFAFANLGRMYEIIRGTRIEARIAAKSRLIDAETAARESGDV